MAGLRIRLEPGWKTYWRAPGDAGIPPQFSWKKSRNLKAVRVHWPRPEVFDQNGLRSIGYEQEVVLPVEFFARDGAGPVEVSGQIALGVCKDICLPVTLSASGTLTDDAPSRADRDTLQRALAERPDTRKSAGAGPVTCSVEPISDGMRITTRITLPKQGGNEFVVIEPPRPDIWVSEAETDRQGGVLVASADLVPPEAQPFSMDRSKVRITVLGRDGAVDLMGCKAG